MACEGHVTTGGRSSLSRGKTGRLINSETRSSCQRRQDYKPLAGKLSRLEFGVRLVGFSPVAGPRFVAAALLHWLKRTQSGGAGGQTATNTMVTRGTAFKMITKLDSGLNSGAQNHKAS